MNNCQYCKIQTENKRFCSHDCCYDWQGQNGGFSKGRKKSEAEVQKIVANIPRGKDHPSQSKKWRRNISRKLKGKKKSKIHCKNISLGRRGIKFTQEHCKNISKAQKGSKKPNKSIAMKGNKNPMWKGGRDTVGHRRKYRNAYMRKKRKEDVQFRLRDRLRCRLNDAVKHGYKNGSAVRDLGCSVGELKKHLEDRFQKGMTWDNWGHGKDKWNIDHIKPLSRFDLTNRGQLKEAVHYTNLQPLWYIDNVKKSNKIYLSDEVPFSDVPNPADIVKPPRNDMANEIIKY